jgi:ATP:corrinoid adenosyltransferase
MLRKYIVKANKDVGVIMEMTTFIMETSRRKAKKAFKKANKNWTIVDIRAKEPEDDIFVAPEIQLAMDVETLGSALAI